MGYSFVLFDVSLVISRWYFHCFFIGHTQNMYSPWAKSYFPVGKNSSGTTTNSLNLHLHVNVSAVHVPVLTPHLVICTETLQHDRKVTKGRLAKRMKNCIQQG